MSAPSLEALLRHREPMLLLTGVIETGPTHAVVEVRIDERASFFQAPEGVPAWVGIEYMAQAVAVLAGSQATDEGGGAPLGYLLGTRSYRCEVPWFTAGTTLRVRCEEQLFDDNGLGVYACAIDAERPLAEARLTVYRKAK
ncbi:MAG: 3-hydroxylacyl-ACP dehydratase [Pseudomonadota bacterium]